MKFNSHTRFEDMHAFLGPSQYHWLNYSDEKLAQVWIAKRQAALLGTEMHLIAAKLIKLKIKQPKTKETFNMYVNDAIKYDLKPEVLLFYSENCFGTADAINFKNNTLIIHDLKTGKTKASMYQLLIYAALFCLEYNVNPHEIQYQLRIYQNNQIIEAENVTAEVIVPIIDKIIHFDNIINSLKQEED